MKMGASRINDHSKASDLTDHEIDRNYRGASTDTKHSQYPAANRKVENLTNKYLSVVLQVFHEPDLRAWSSPEHLESGRNGQYQSEDGNDKRGKLHAAKATTCAHPRRGLIPPDPEHPPVASRPLDPICSPAAWAWELATLSLGVCVVAFVSPPM